MYYNKIAGYYSKGIFKKSFFAGSERIGLKKTMNELC
jgi:hypothetical protein